MSQLTTTARKTLLGLILGNLIIGFALLQLGQYYAHTHSFISANAIRSLTRLVNQLQKNPQSSWPSILQNRHSRWSEISLSPTPVYEQNALLTLKAPVLFNLMKQNKKLEFSLFIQENAWLNVSMIPPASNQLNFIVSLLFILLGTLILINYWAVRTLNQPIQTLIQSLSYNENLENWLPIPLTGNSDQKAIFKKINDLQEKVNKLLANRTRVVTAISHDLRTPLTRLKLRTEYLTDTPHYAKINADINEMELMIQETLDYFRDINHEEKPQRFDLVALLSSLSDDALELNYEVHFTSDCPKLIYLGSVNLLKRALSNLINNAVHYGAQATIHLQCLPQQVEIIITDKGPGLPAEELEQAFLPFYRGEHSRSRSTGGTGLGLTIAREIVQMHQGDISLSNLLEGGLKVCITLPLKPA
ncbi:sensor histidine kinase [Legionella saoudiensis]|uniref:sensor histidine kinase n=1 Tax=Legionella saoudiensis TaxID=1750561 RepID=UPI000730631E|nr:ATP-binding protein [Legionella saoudiensis]